MHMKRMQNIFRYLFRVEIVQIKSSMYFWIKFFDVVDVSILMNVSVLRPKKMY